MAAPTIEDLQSEIDHLRTLVASLSAALLLQVAVETLKDFRTATRADAEHLVHEAEECFRCARLGGIRKEIAAGLEVAGNELMSKAVEIETRLQREGRKDN